MRGLDWQKTVKTSDERPLMSKAKVMIVEDEYISASAMKIGLQELGYDVCELKYSGEEAVKDVEKENPDVILMDIHLKGKLGGIEAARRIKSKFEVPIIFLTGYVDNETMKQAGAVDYNGYLVKPIELEQLEESLKETLEKKHRGS
jgi:CheY-like chemotaxis protein